MASHPDLPPALIDRTSLTGLRIDASIGVYDFEYQIKQPLVIDVTVHSDLRRAAETDALEHAVDYDRIAKICRSVAGGQHHRLIETVAGRIADEVLQALSAVMTVDVSVAKPGAVPDAASVSVAIRRIRGV
ncbi:MAG: dihydroneopterin aldolase, partial [Myxococcota bacterium]